MPDLTQARVDLLDAAAILGAWAETLTRAADPTREPEIAWLHARAARYRRSADQLAPAPGSPEPPAPPAPTE